MSLDRRTFLRKMGSGAALAAWAATPLARPFEALAANGPATGNGYGPLSTVRDDATGLPLLELPAGFRYVSFGWTGDLMSDGRPTPIGHDGGAVFAGPGGRLHYVRNHELSLDPRISNRTSFAGPANTYDAGQAPGGVTTVVFDPRRGRALETHPRLSGTLRNCAGGPTPWGTWLSCEESLDDPSFAYRDALLEETHGWVFEVPPFGPVAAEPLRGLGRMWHEAVAIDPRTGIAYQTEDRDTSGLYRFLPNRPGQLARGGRLEMLAVRGVPRFDSHVDAEQGRWMDVAWLPIADVERPHSDSVARDGLGVFSQGHEAGGARFRRGEGIWSGAGRIFFVATDGGAAGLGQVFELDPGAARLRLLYESTDPGHLNQPDNLTVSPRGGLVLCEDAAGSVQHLRGLDPAGRLFDLARNAVVLDGERGGLRGDFRSKEWAGACFSPDGRWLFASIQNPGISFAITGPWERGAL